MDLSAAPAGRPDAPRYGGFWIRAWATLLDLLWIAALNQALTLAGLSWDRFAIVTAGIGSASLTLDPTVSPLPTLLIIAFWIWKGATPGKMICGLRIIDARTGGHPTAWQFVGRYVMSFISMAVAGIGILWVAIDPRKQGWHDKIVGTVVIQRR